MVVIHNLTAIEACLWEVAGLAEAMKKFQLFMSRGWYQGGGQGILSVIERTKEW
jgi:hypothetical protein